MGGPLRPKSKAESRCAEPIQPDVPSRGIGAESDRASSDPQESLDRALEQELAAIDDVRDA